MSVKSVSSAARSFIKYVYLLPKDVLSEYVFKPVNKDIVNEIREAYQVETPEELIYHLYEGTWYEE